MFKKLIMKGVALVNNGSTAAVKIPPVDFDKVLIRLSQNNTANKLLVANHDKLTVLLSLITGEITTPILKNRFLDLCNESNLKLGYVGSDTEYEYQCLMDVGTINKSDFTDGSIIFSLANIASLDSAPKVDVELILSDAAVDKPVIGRESISINGQYQFSSCLELIQMDAPSDRTIVITDPDTGDEYINDTIALAESKLLGNYEANAAVPFIWGDNSGHGKEITVLTPTALNYLVLTRK